MNRNSDSGVDVVVKWRKESREKGLVPPKNFAGMFVRMEEL